MIASGPSAHALFLSFSRHKLIESYWPRLRECVESLTDEQVWWRPNDASNSAGNLLLHLNGNVRQWLVSPFTGVGDVRDRPAEFGQRDIIAARVLLSRMSETMNDADAVLRSLTEPQLVASYHIQGYTVTGLEAVYQVVEHFAMHYGQVLYITKLLRAANLGYYSELDATGRLPASE